MKKKEISALSSQCIPGTSKNSNQTMIPKRTTITKKRRIPMRYVIDIAPKKNQKVSPSTTLTSAAKRKLEEKCTRQQKRIKWLQDKLFAGMKEIAALKDQLSDEQKLELAHEETNMVIVDMGELEEEG